MHYAELRSSKRGFALVVLGLLFCWKCGDRRDVHRFSCCVGEAEKTGYVPSVPEF